MLHVFLIFIQPSVCIQSRRSCPRLCTRRLTTSRGSRRSSGPWSRYPCLCRGIRSSRSSSSLSSVCGSSSSCRSRWLARHASVSGRGSHKGNGSAVEKWYPAEMLLAVGIQPCRKSPRHCSRRLTTSRGSRRSSGHWSRYPVCAAGSEVEQLVQEQMACAACQCKWRRLKTREMAQPLIKWYPAEIL